MTPDPVNNPPHYNKGDIECIDAIEAMLTHEEYVGYLRGNSLKYRWRFRYKDFIQDLKKAEWYENRLLEELKRMPTKFKQSYTSRNRQTGVVTTEYYWMKGISKRVLFEELNKESTSLKLKHKIRKELKRRGIKIRNKK